MELRTWSRQQPDFGTGPIQVRVPTVEQLFNPMDPTPLADRTLDQEVADWIEEWAEDIEDRGPLTVEVIVADGHVDDRETAVVAGLRGHFEYREWQLGRQLHRLLREGRISLVIGLAALAFFNAASRLIGESDNPVVQVIHEGLSVLGWVSMWKPLEILLYEWWPIRRERRVCKRLAEATFTFPSAASTSASVR